MLVNEGSGTSRWDSVTAKKNVFNNVGDHGRFWWTKWAQKILTRSVRERQKSRSPLIDSGDDGDAADHRLRGRVHDGYVRRRRRQWRRWRARDLVSGWRSRWNWCTVVVVVPVVSGDGATSFTTWARGFASLPSIPDFLHQGLLAGPDLPQANSRPARTDTYILASVWSYLAKFT